MPAQSRALQSPNVNRRKVCSRITNGNGTLLFGDGRSAGARRYRDLMQQLGDELGGAPSLAASDLQVLRRAVSACVECELLDATRASGKPVDVDAYVAIQNAAGRAMRAFQAVKARLSIKAKPSLADRWHRPVSVSA